MRFGLHSGQHQVSIAELRGLWSFARQAGFDACYLFDHFRPLFSDVDRFLPEEAHSPSGGCLEAFTTLGSLARSVPQIGIGIMVAGAGYRSVSLVGHMTATLAQAAPGRVELGLGAGWFEPEYAAYGYPYPEADRRLVELRTSLEWLRTRLRDGAFAGAAAPRLWVAGRGPLIRLAAEHADSWNTMFVTPKGFGRAVEELAEACAAAGRDPSSIERSVALRAFCSRDPGRAHAALEGLAALRGREVERVRARSLVGSPEDCAEQLAAYVDAGANHLAVMVHPPYDLDALALLGGEVFPRFRTAG
jgi:alkanesulfonate monooxygenase SsuD/methylene tetrahydromethanopterin reductase-like flavin-dependent oxidoreductase (luciferase family)